MVAEDAPGHSARALEAAAALLGDDQVDGAVAADRKNVVVLADIRVGLAMLHIRTIAPDPGQDRLTAFRVLGHLARQGQEHQRSIEVEQFDGHALRQALPLGLLALAELRHRGRSGHRVQ